MEEREYNNLTLGEINVYIPVGAKVSPQGMEISLTGKWLLQSLAINGIFK